MASFMAVEQPSTLLKNQAWLSVWVVLGGGGDGGDIGGGGDGHLLVIVGGGGGDHDDAGCGCGDGGGVDGGGRVYGGHLVVRVGRHQVGRGVQQLLHHSLYLVK